MNEQKVVADRFALYGWAVRIALRIVGPFPVLMVALIPAVALEAVIELATWDSSYYQQHKWCPFVACLLSGSFIFLLRRVPFLEHGIWMGPALFVLGTIMFLR
jgi:hypothetical protein